MENIIQNIKEVNEKLEQQNNKIQKLEQNLSLFRDFQVLTASGEKLIDALTNYIMDQGFNQKVRELKTEFFSRKDFQSVESKFMTHNDLQKSTKEIYQIINEQKRQINSINESGRDIENGVSKVQKIIDNMVTKNDYEELSAVIETKQSILNAERYQEKCDETYFSIENADELQKDIDDRFLLVHDTLDTKAAQEDVIQYQEELRKLIDNNFEKTSQFKDCFREKVETRKQLEKAFLEIEKLKKRIKNLENTSEQHSKEIENKVNIYEYESIYALIKDIPTNKQTDQLKNYVVKNIESFIEDHKNYHLDFQTQNEIIRRYDEILLQKVSMISYKEEQQRQLLEVKKIIQEAKDQFINTQNNNNQQNLFDKAGFQEQIMTEVESKIEQQIQRERARNQYQQNLLMKQKSGSEDEINNLRNLMKNKADLIDLERLYDVKADKLDFNNLLKIQQIVSNQLKHIVILYIEIVNCHTEKASDTKLSSEKRVHNLVQQLHSYTNWVLNFDPQNFMNSAEEANKQFIEKIDGQQFKDFKDLVLKDFGYKLNSNGFAHFAKNFKIKTLKNKFYNLKQKESLNITSISKASKFDVPIQLSQSLDFRDQNSFMQSQINSKRENIVERNLFSGNSARNHSFLNTLQNSFI